MPLLAYLNLHTTSLLQNRKSTDDSLFLAVTSLFISGVHFGWPSSAIPQLLSDEYPFDITREDASYIILLSSLSHMLGTVLATYSLDFFGRKNTLLLIGLPQFTAFVLIACCNFSPIFLYCARFMGGISEGACFIALPTYVGEVTEPKVRGVLGCCITLTMMFGIITSNIVGIYLSVTTSAMLYALMPIFYILAFWRMPESPYYYIIKSRPTEARSSLQFLRHKNDVEEELAMITKDIARQLSEPGRYIDLIRIDSNRKALIAMAGLRVIQQYTGISPFVSYAQLMFQEATDVISAEGSTLIFLGIDCTVTTVALLFVDRLGRKPLLFWSCSISGLILIALGVFFTLRDYTGIDVSSVSWLPLLGIILYTITYASGIGMIVNLMLGEVFSASIKAKALGVMNIILAVAMFSVTKFFQYTMDQLGLAVPFYSFGLITVFGALFCVYCVPETKGKTLEQIQQELKGNKLPK